MAGWRLRSAVDDGPSAPNKGQLLELLEGYGARATFFVVGEELAATLELACRAADAGHELGNHTFSRPFPERFSDGELREEIVRGTAAIEEIAGVTPRVAPTDGPPPGYTIHVSVERVDGVGPWT